jgi:hypothetical protein
MERGNRSLNVCRPGFSQKKALAVRHTQPLAITALAPSGRLADLGLSLYQPNGWLPQFSPRLGSGR